MEQRSGFSTKALGSQTEDNVQLKDVLWVPLLMLPVVILLGLAMSRVNRN
jgi:hypothetical protein